jgi:hypothetical protein
MLHKPDAIYENYKKYQSDIKYYCETDLYDIY